MPILPPVDEVDDAPDFLEAGLGEDALEDFDLEGHLVLLLIG
jgi:hypothetical protein